MADGVGHRAFAENRVRGVAAARAFAPRLEVEGDERTAARAALAQTADGLVRGGAGVDDDGFGDLAQQRVERRFEALRRAHAFRGGDGIRDQLHHRAADVLVLSFQGHEQRAQRVDLVRRLRDRVARGAEGLAHGLAIRGELVAVDDRLAQRLLRDDEVLFGVADGLLPLVHLRQRAVAALGGLACALGELGQVELALLDRDLDLVHLVPCLGDLGDGAHERLARFGEGFLVLADGVAFFLAVALDLIGGLAEAVALRAGGLELLGLLIERGLLLGCFRFERGDLRAAGLDALEEVAKVGLGLLEKGAQALDFTGESGDLLADFRRAMGAVGVDGARLRELRFVGAELRGELALTVLRVDDSRARGFLFDLGDEDAALVERALGERELVGELFVPARLRRLALEGVQVPRHLGQRVVDAQEVLLGLFEFELGGASLGLVLGDAGRFFDKLAAVLRLVGEDQVDLPLLHDGVVPDAESGVHEDVRDVLHPDALAVQAELGLAVAEDAAVDRDPAVVGHGVLAVAVERAEGEGDLAHGESAAARGALEDDVFHRLAADVRGAVLPEDPDQGVADVRLSAAVRPDHGREGRGEGQFGGVVERLEAVNFQLFETEHFFLFERTRGGS